MTGWILDKSAHVRLLAGQSPPPDLFIAETAIYHGTGVLHRDRDYARITGVRPSFRARELG